MVRSTQPANLRQGYDLAGTAAAAAQSDNE